MLHDSSIQLVMTAITAVAALNWAVVEFAQTNLLTDLLGLTVGTGSYQAVVGLIAVSATVRLMAAYSWYEEEGGS